MAKKKINDYIFQPGVGKNTNLFPDAYWLIENNLDYIKAEANGFIANRITVDSAVNLRVEAVRLLTANKTFLQDEITAWIAAQVAGNIAPFVGFTYDSAKCKRDVGFVIDAYIYDIRYGGNEKTIDVSKQYWLGGAPQVDGSRAAEVAAHQRLRDIINNNILPRVAIASQQSPATSTQNTTAPSAEAGTTTIITTLSGILTSVIQNGLSVLPTVQYSIYPFAGYVYDSVKCARDIGYVLNAYLHDLRYGGNISTRNIASRYWDNGIPQVDGDRQPEVVTHEFIRDLITNSVLPETGAPFTYQSAINRVDSGAKTAEPGSPTRISTLAGIIINVITNGVSSNPAPVYGVSTIKLQGRYELEDLLLITNASTNSIIYNFGDPQLGAVINYFSAYNSNENYFDSDFPTFLQTSDSITTLYLTADTSSASATDSIQIFVEDHEQRVRPYDFGTDAIERLRVAQPQSMLDADFEYGLQPTKWQAIGIARGYPSVYEVPGTDTAVANVTTDASSGTGGVGESLITVTTVGNHGFTVGTPITIKALANTISGFSRAEGTFIINSVPTTSSFTYYAVAKVGTTNGQVLASTYSQLRRAAFYTGANIGAPTISVQTNGISGTFNSKFITNFGTDQIAITGTMPPIGSPIAGFGISTGCQVTSIVGPGGASAAVTPTLQNNVNPGDTSIVLNGSAGVLEGMGVDNGSGTSIFVSGISGNTVSFTGSFTSAKIGRNQTFLNVSGSAQSPAGDGAIFTIGVIEVPATDPVEYAFAVNAITTPGTNYQVGNRIKILGTNFTGGATPLNDLTLQVGSIDANGGITAVVIISSTAPGTTGSYANLTGTILPNIGTNASFDITRSNGTYSTVTINVSGSDWKTGDRILVSGTSLSGASPANDLLLEVTNTSAGSISQISVISGTAVQGENIEFWSAISLSELTTSQISDNTVITASAIAKFLATFTSNHGLAPGSSVIVTINSNGTNHELAAGPSYVEQITSPTTFIWTARAPGTVDTTVQLSGVIYARPDSFFIHRPFDGGVQLGTGGPQHGAQSVRMSKKYIRYQSGKGIMYTTGALFAPSYNLSSANADGLTPGSYITIVTDDVDHGCQVGAEIRVIGVETSGYNGHYVVTDVVNERTLKVQAQTTLGNLYGKMGPEAQISLYKWHGATVRAGTFDDQNGMFWQYDGQYLSVGRRFSTFQLAGTITIQPDTNLVTGTATRFRDQVKAGDKVVIRGMTHVVTSVSSDTSLTVNPDYRGVVTATNAKMCLIQDIIIRQQQFNKDKLDGLGSSGYNIDITKMQMIGIQWSWYGAGFIDFMLRGSDGNFVFAHRIRTSNVNTEAYMRTGNLPVRYEVINESAVGLLANSITSSQTTIPLVDATLFPSTAGIVYVDNEIIAFSGKSGNSLIGCTRSAPLVNFVGGAQRTFTAGAAATHEYNTGVILISCTTSPIISHWGSAMLTDGRFDEDRGYIFSYAATNISITTTKQTAFLIRLAPTVSNALVGDLGERELLNRAQLLLKGIEITSDTGTGGIVIEGVLNPQNYPINPSAIAWGGLAGSAQGGQPSFAQIAPGGSVSWASGTTQTTANATVATFPTGSVTARSISWRSNRSLENGSNWFAITQADFTSYTSQGLEVGDAISGTGIPANTFINQIQFWYNDSTLGALYIIYMSQNANQNVNGNSTLTVSKTYQLQGTSVMFFTTASWNLTGATTGTEVSDARFPANTFVTRASNNSYFGTTYVRAQFSQTSTSSAVVPGTTTITFRFGQPPYGLPGETVFSFIANPGSSSHLYLDELKELTNTTLGGRGTYPNGPDVLAINVYKASGAAVTANIVLRWGEAQA